LKKNNLVISQTLKTNNDTYMDNMKINTAESYILQYVHIIYCTICAFYFLSISQFIMILDLIFFFPSKIIINYFNSVI